MAVVLSALNGQSSWARHYLRRTTDEVDWNHRVNVEAQMIVNDIVIEPEYNGSKFPEPVMYLTGKVQEMEGDFGYGVKRVTFGSDMRGADEPEVRIRWAFTPEEAAQLYRLGLHTGDFEIPQELTGISYTLPMQTAVDTVVPNLEGQSVPVMVVHIIDEGAIPMDTQKSGYFNFIERYMKPSPTMAEHGRELSAFNRSFHSDIEAYFGMRALENGGLAAEVDELFDLSEDAPDIVARVTEEADKAPEKVTPEKSLAYDIIAEVGDEPEPVIDYGSPEDTIEDILGVDEEVVSPITENTLDDLGDFLDEDMDAADALFGDMMGDDEEVTEEMGKDEASVDAAELARRNARRRAAEEAISEPEVVPVEVEAPDDSMFFDQDDDQLEI